MESGNGQGHKEMLGTREMVLSYNAMFSSHVTSAPPKEAAQDWCLIAAMQHPCCGPAVVWIQHCAVPLVHSRGAQVLWAPRSKAGALGGPTALCQKA